MLRPRLRETGEPSALRRLRPSRWRQRSGRSVEQRVRGYSSPHRHKRQRQRSPPVPASAARPMPFGARRTFHCKDRHHTARPGPRVAKCSDRSQERNDQQEGCGPWSCRKLEVRKPRCLQEISDTRRRELPESWMSCLSGHRRTQGGAEFPLLRKRRDLPRGSARQDRSCAAMIEQQQPGGTQQPGNSRDTQQMRRGTNARQQQHIKLVTGQYTPTWMPRTMARSSPNPDYSPSRTRRFPSNVTWLSLASTYGDSLAQGSQRRRDPGSVIAAPYRCDQLDRSFVNFVRRHQQ
jgi:hypothetical protein